MTIQYFPRHAIKQWLKTPRDTEYAIISVSDTPDEYDEMTHILNQTSHPHITLMFADTDDASGITPLQAQTILSFVNDNKDKEFVIHCFAGVSRSAAVAKFINEYLSRDMVDLAQYSLYNRRVFNKLRAAAGLDLASFYEQLEAEDREKMFPQED